MRLYGIDRMIVFLALLLGAMLVLLWLSQPKPLPLTGLSPDKVSEIRSFRKGQLELNLLRDRSGWMLTHPDIQRAHSRRVTQLLGLLQTSSQGSWPVSPQALQETGLAQPERSLRFDALQIDFGTASTPPGQRYVRVGNRIHLIDDLWFKLSGLPASHYRGEE